jgi:hypothetical protein
MENLNLSKICQDLISDLPERQEEVILRRFGFGKFKERQTLEEIGKNFGITRERVRQIQEDAFSKIREKLENYKNVYKDFERYFLSFGGVKKEEILLQDLGQKKWEKEVYFLLSLDKKFKRYPEKREHFAFWALEGNFVERAKKNIEILSQKLREIGKPIPLKNLSFISLEKPALISLLEITKLIQKNEEGLYGLREWPEINPRGIRDKAYLALKKVKKPLHFTEITKLIEGAHLQTVHNELIKDERFVLIGRGIYALREWGYEPGFVKDLLIKILKEKGPLEKEKVLKEILRQRMVKENTVLLNLSNRKYFSRDPQGRYRLKPGLI